MAVPQDTAAAGSGSYHGYFLNFLSDLFSTSFLDESHSQNVASSNTQVLNGDYSCKFTGTYPTEEAILATKNFDISTSYNFSVLVFFSIYLEDMPTGNTITVTADFGDGRTLPTHVELEATNKWLIQKSALFDVPAGATTVAISLVLPGVYRSSLPVVGYVDNFGIYLQSAPVSRPRHYTIFSDTGGALTARDLSNGTEIWTFHSAYGFLTAKPTIVEGTAFFGDGDTLCNIYALHGDSGAKKFVQGYSGSIDATPEVVGDTVYITTSTGYLHTLNKDTGAKTAEYDILGLATGKHAKIYSNQLAGNTIVMTSQLGVFGFDVQTKQVSFRHPLNYSVDTIPLVHNGIAYYGDLDGEVYAVDFKTNQSRWKSSMGGPIHASPKMVGEYVLFGCDDGNLYAFDMATGGRVATLSKPGHFVRSFSAASNRLYVAFNAIDGKVIAYEIKKPVPTEVFTELWSFDVELGVERDPLVIGDRICFAGNDKKCYCLNADTGMVYWLHTTAITGFTEPALIPLTPTQPSSRRYDQYCYLMSHNSFADFLNGWWLGNQEMTITDQLNFGVRGLMLDTHKVQVAGVDQIVLYHETSWSAPTWHYLETALVEIREWLENNPTEVVTIQFQNRQRDPTLTASTLAAAGVTNLIFDPTKNNVGPHGTWGPVLTDGWPTIGWMVQNNKRLVLFAEKSYDGLPYVWNYTVETWYGNKSMTGNYDERDESKTIPLSKNRSLYTVNYFPDMWFWQPSLVSLSYNSINSFDSLMSRADVCKFNPRFNVDPKLGWVHHLPNFLAIDFVSRGGDGGALRAVKEINLLWTD